LPVPPPGRVSVAVSPEVPAAFHQAIGYPRAGPLAVRVDMLDRLERNLHRFRDASGLKADLGLAQLIGCAPEHLDQLLVGLGYRRAGDVEGAATYRRRPPQRHRDGAVAGDTGADSPFAKLKEIELAR
jgi:ATP-dependent RNA helicase SUPV3L1/SUV3